MTGSRVTRRLGRLVRAWAVASAAVVVLGAGAAQAANAGTAVAGPGVVGGHARPVVAAARPMHPDATGQECFFSADCTSADPTVSFTIASNGDSTGCTFQQDTSWGDGSADTVKTYKGGKDGAPLATFTHTYAAPGMFQIGMTFTVTVNPGNKCGGGTDNLQFTLAAPPILPCRSSQVTVPATTAALRPSERGIGITYGPAQLTFTPGVKGTGAQCTMQPAVSSLPVELSIPGVVTPILLGETDLTATIDLLAASSVATSIPFCDFAPLESLTNPSITPPLSDFAHTNNCFLTPTFHASWDVVARLTVPSGAVQMAHNQVTNTDTAIYSTQPLTYYVDLDTLPLPAGFSGDTMSALVDFIYSTLAENIPVLDRIALIQAPSGHLLVINPRGRRIGLDSKNQAHAFAGVGYTEVGGRSIAWMLEPAVGDYNVSVRAQAGSTFSVDMADLQFLGHGEGPLVENFTWNGTLGHTGTATKRFSVRGTALSPVLSPTESQTRVKPHARVRFTLGESVTPLGISKVVWLFGEGSRATDRSTKHRYSKPGHYTPTLTVTDAVGYTVTVKLPTIVVKN